MLFKLAFFKDSKRINYGIEFGKVSRGKVKDVFLDEFLGNGLVGAACDCSDVEAALYGFLHDELAALPFAATTAIFLDMVFSVSAPQGCFIGGFFVFTAVPFDSKNNTEFALYWGSKHFKVLYIPIDNYWR